MAHAKDRMSDGRFATAGKGVLDYGHYLRSLTSIGFGGSLITHGLSANEAEGVEAFLTAKLKNGVGAQR
jgi:sugar phosphate isomerase/epimerase